MHRTVTKFRNIVIDLDGTLVLTDMLFENTSSLLRIYPIQIFALIFWLFLGKTQFKNRLADLVIPNVDCLPYSMPLIVWLRQQREQGARLILATASDVRIANKVADYLGIFDEVIGTESVNMASKNKRDELVRRYGEQGFEYIGNSKADLAVWRSASVIHIANPDCGVLNAAKKIGKIGMVFNTRPSYFRTLVKTLRIHQWTKNLLLFVPLLASHRFSEVQLLYAGVCAFLAFGMCASSVYLLNDLLDLSDDRQHPTKSKRPLASGNFPIADAVFLIPLLLVCAFGLAFAFLPITFTLILAAYYGLTLAYSLWFKRIVMLDVVLLAMLYTVRVVAGAAAMALATTFWILAFCMFIFLSLAFVKRYTELRDARLGGKKDKSAGRGYYPADFELLASLGGSSGYISVMVLALYINESGKSALYHSPEWMWGACPLLLFWLSRVWLLAHRGQMHDDPIVFALRDSTSRWVGLAFVFVFVMATF